MARVSIERLNLQLTHRSESDGRRLAHLLAASLANALPAIPGGEVSHLSLSIRAEPGESAERLTARITAELAQRITAARE